MRTEAQKLANRLYMREYNAALTPEKKRAIKEQRRVKRGADPEATRAYRRVKYARRREAHLVYMAEYRARQNPVARRAYVNEWCAKQRKDPARGLKILLRRRLCMALKNRAKRGSAVKELGCSIEFLIEHLENQFQPGMSWDNRGRNGWHIDHIRPLASFDLTDPEQFRQAAHYTNLQPLWATDNLRKSARW